MGTPAFACPTLEALLARPDPVVGVVCQPDRPRGRGLAVTGVTIMAMNEEMDAGDVLLTRTTPIHSDDTGGTLTDRLARLGADAIGEAIDGLAGGTIRPVPQPAVGITFAPRIERAQCRLDWTRTAAELE